MEEPFSKMIAQPIRMQALVGAPSLAGGGAAIDDATTGLNTVWSSQKTADEIAAVEDVLRALLTGGAPDLSALTTADKANLVAAVNEINAAVGYHLRFDASQSLTSAQKAQGLANLGALPAPATASNGDALLFNGTSWYAGNVTATLGEGRLDVTGVTSGAPALTIPAGSQLILDGISGNHGLFYSSGMGYTCGLGYFYFNLLLAGDISEIAAYGVNLGAWLIKGNGRVVRSYGEALTAGNTSLNAWSGKVRIPAGSSSIQVANAYVQSTSHVDAKVVGLSEDETLKQVIRTHCVAGKFYVFGNAPATNGVDIIFEVNN